MPELRPAPDTAARTGTVAVTGAGGFLGARVATLLATAGLGVTGFGRSAPTGLGSAVAAAAWDGRQPAPAGLQVAAVVDCAAAIPARQPDPDLMIATNVALARNAVDLAARGSAPLIYMSSQSAVGRPKVAVIDASTPPEPDTPYGHSKLAAERLIAEAVASGALPWAVALRLPAVIGAGCHDNFPATVAARLAAGETVTVFNPDGLYNAVVHADTVAAFVRRLLAGPPAGIRVVAPAAASPIPIREAVEAIADGLGVACRMEIRAAAQASPVIDPSAAAALGFVPDDTRAVLSRFGAEAALRIATPPPPR